MVYYLVALDIKAIGSSFVLQYEGNGENSSVTIVGKPFNLNAIPYPVVGVFSSNKSVAEWNLL